LRGVPRGPALFRGTIKLKKRKGKEERQETKKKKPGPAVSKLQV